MLQSPPSAHYRATDISIGGGAANDSVLAAAIAASTSQASSRTPSVAAVAASGGGPAFQDPYRQYTPVAAATPRSATVGSVAAPVVGYPRDSHNNHSSHHHSSQGISVTAVLTGLKQQ